MADYGSSGLAEFHTQQHTHNEGKTMIFRHLTDWLVMRLFFLSALVACCTTAQADVILWEAGLTESVAFTPIAGGEIRSQAIDLATAATARAITLSIGQPWWLAGTGGPAQISVWLDSTPAERRTLIYSGAFRSSWSGLAVDLPKGRSFLSLENLAGSQTINWNQQIIGGVAGSYMGRIQGVSVPEPEMVVLLVCCCVTGVIMAWRVSRGER